MATRDPEAVYRRNRDFIKKIHERGVPSSEVSEDVELKRNYLKFFGYTSLKSEGGRSKIENCSDGRVHIVFFRVYESAQNQVLGFEKNKREDDSFYRGIARLIEREKRLSTPNEELSERIGIMMDSADDITLRLLSRRYGQSALGKYFTP